LQIFACRYLLYFSAGRWPGRSSGISEVLLIRRHLKHADFPVFYISSLYPISFSNYLLLDFPTPIAPRSSGAASQSCRFLLEVVSKPQIRLKGKAFRALEAERTRKYVSISMRGTTQPLSLRWGFETTS